MAIPGLYTEDSSNRPSRRTFLFGFCLSMNDYALKFDSCKRDFSFRVIFFQKSMN